MLNRISFLPFTDCSPSSCSVCREPCNLSSFPQAIIKSYRLVILKRIEGCLVHGSGNWEVQELRVPGEIGGDTVQPSRELHAPRWRTSWSQSAHVGNTGCCVTHQRLTVHAHLLCYCPFKLLLANCSDHSLVSSVPLDNGSVTATKGSYLSNKTRDSKARIETCELRDLE